MFGLPANEDEDCARPQHTHTLSVFRALQIKKQACGYLENCLEGEEDYDWMGEGGSALDIAMACLYECVCVMWVRSKEYSHCLIDHIPISGE